MTWLNQRQGVLSQNVVNVDTPGFVARDLKPVDFSQELRRASDERGNAVRRYSPLALERNKVTFFPLSWTIVHPIDSASPLAGKTPEDLKGTQAEILVHEADPGLIDTYHTRRSRRGA